MLLFVRAEEAVKEEGKEEGLQIAFSKFASFPFRRRFVLLRLSKKTMSAPPAPGGAAATDSNAADTITLSIRTLAPATHIVSVSSTVGDSFFFQREFPIDLRRLFASSFVFSFPVLLLAFFPFKPCTALCALFLI